MSSSSCSTFDVALHFQTAPKLLYRFIPVYAEMLVEFDSWLCSAIQILIAFGQRHRLILYAAYCTAPAARHSTNPCDASSRALNVRRGNIYLLNPWINSINFVKLEWCTGPGGSLVNSGFPWGCPSSLGFTRLSVKKSLQISLTVSRVAIS